MATELAEYHRRKQTRFAEEIEMHFIKPNAPARHRLSETMEEIQADEYDEVMWYPEQMDRKELKEVLREKYDMKEFVGIPTVQLRRKLREYAGLPENTQDDEDLPKKYRNWAGPEESEIVVSDSDSDLSSESEESEDDNGNPIPKKPKKEKTRAPRRIRKAETVNIEPELQHVLDGDDASSSSHFDEASGHHLRPRRKLGSSHPNRMKDYLVNDETSASFNHNLPSSSNHQHGNRPNGSMAGMRGDDETESEESLDESSHYGDPRGQQHSSHHPHIVDTNTSGLERAPSPIPTSFSHRGRPRFSRVRVDPSFVGYGGKGSDSDPMDDPKGANVVDRSTKRRKIGDVIQDVGSDYSSLSPSSRLRGIDHSPNSHGSNGVKRLKLEETAEDRRLHYSAGGAPRRRFSSNMDIDEEYIPSSSSHSHRQRDHQTEFIPGSVRRAMKYAAKTSESQAQALDSMASHAPSSSSRRNGEREPHDALIGLLGLSSFGPSSSPLASPLSVPPSFASPLSVQSNSMGGGHADHIPTAQLLREKKMRQSDASSSSTMPSVMSAPVPSGVMNNPLLNPLAAGMVPLGIFNPALASLAFPNLALSQYPLAAPGQSPSSGMTGAMPGLVGQVPGHPQADLMSLYQQQISALSFPQPIPMSAETTASQYAAALQQAAFLQQLHTSPAALALLRSPLLAASVTPPPAIPSRSASPFTTNNPTQPMATSATLPSSSGLASPSTSPAPSGLMTSAAPNISADTIISIPASSAMQGLTEAEKTPQPDDKPSEPSP